ILLTGSPATATTRPPREGPTIRQRRSLRYAGSTEAIVPADAAAWTAACARRPIDSLRSLIGGTADDVPMLKPEADMASSHRRQPASRRKRGFIAEAPFDDGK